MNKAGSLGRFFDPERKPNGGDGLVALSDCESDVLDVLAEVPVFRHLSGGAHGFLPGHGAVREFDAYRIGLCLTL